uniref:Uncharacterized protein n=1 Tax=Gorilla gorilla gorilla TaxID=9595 RepID=A0A2I2ZW39_GORGO
MGEEAPPLPFPPQRRSLNTSPEPLKYSWELQTKKHSNKETQLPVYSQLGRGQACSRGGYRASLQMETPSCWTRPRAGLGLGSCSHEPMGVPM